MVNSVCLESRRSLFRTPLWPSSSPLSSKHDLLSLPTGKDSILWGAYVTKRWRARPQTAKARISNPVSGGQCHPIHLTILRRFSWPSLAYMCTKVARTPFILFHLPPIHARNAGADPTTSGNGGVRNELITSLAIVLVI